MDLGIVYHIDDARQFWAELEDILQVSASSTLTRLDSALKNFVSFCATYHEQYLQTPVQLEHACCLLLDSEIFHFHSERLSSLVISDALSNTDPHAQLILHNLLLLHGRRHPSFLRSPKKWTELIPLLMDHILLVDVDCEGYNSGSSNAWRGGIGVPIEARLRTLAVGILYEVCRVQKFDAARLMVFDDAFIDHLFELVEATRDMQDETLNYCLIKLIVSLNEQFMVSALQPHKEDTKDKPKSDNRVIQILMRRLGASKTFGENLIFMLNRADRSAEDKCMQLLVLKILYLLFTTPGTQEYFYTNDLCVLVDVFIRELVDLDEDSESLRHTYLRVLHPLLTHTQLRSTPYKRQQILRTLESLVAHAEIRDVSPTTKRLVDRCLSGSWAVQVKKEREAARASASAHHGAISPISSGSPSPDQGHVDTHPASHFLNPSSAPHPLKDERYIKMSRSVDVLTLKAPKDGSGHHDAAIHKKMKPKTKLPPGLDIRRNSNESSLSLVSVAGAAPGPKYLPTSPTPGTPSTSASTSRIHAHSDASRRPGPDGKRHTGTPPISPSIHTSSRAGDMLNIMPATPIFDDQYVPSPFLYSDEPEQDSEPLSLSDSPPPLSDSQPPLSDSQPPPRYRPAPAPPPKRRKPPAVPSRSTKAGGGRSGTTMTTIASSKPVPAPVPSPLSR